MEKLPPEILAHILDCLGPPFFRKDVRRLTVGKTWYSLARPVLFGSLELDAASLHRFAQKVRKGSVDSIISHVGQIMMSLQGFDEWDSLEMLPGMYNRDREVIQQWTVQLNKDLSLVARIMEKFTKLQSISLTAWQERFAPRLGIPRRSYLNGMAVVGAVCAKNITSLDIDIGGSHFTSETPLADFHPCEFYRSIPRALRRLRVRASCICPDILRVPAPGEGGQQLLEDVIVNLSLANMAEFDTSYRYPVSCKPQPGGFPQLRNDMEAQAIELAKELKHARIVRVISHSFPGLDTCAFDAITGSRLVLPSPTIWDADGKALEEEATDSESEISDEVDI